MRVIIVHYPIAFLCEVLHVFSLWGALSRVLACLYIVFITISVCFLPYFVLYKKAKFISLFIHTNNEHKHILTVTVHMFSVFLPPHKT